MLEHTQLVSVNGQVSAESLAITVLKERHDEDKQIHSFVVKQGHYMKALEVRVLQHAERHSSHWDASVRWLMATAQPVRSGTTLVGLSTQGVDSTGIHVLQVSTESRCLVCHVTDSKDLSPLMRRLLEDAAVFKAGADIWTVAVNLWSYYRVQVKSCLEVNAPRSLQDRKLSLETICKQTFGTTSFYKDVEIVCSDWSVEQLSLRQLVSAAIDAQASYYAGCAGANKHLRANTTTTFDIGGCKPELLASLVEWYRDLQEEQRVQEQRREITVDRGDVFKTDEQPGSFFVQMTRYQTRIRLQSRLRVHWKDGSFTNATVLRVDGQSAIIRCSSDAQAADQINHITLSRADENNATVALNTSYVLGQLVKQSLHAPLLRALFDMPRMTGSSSPELRQGTDMDPTTEDRKWLDRFATDNNPTHSTLNTSQLHAIQMAESHHVSIVQGPCGTGKCWGAGTELLMYDGSSKTVESIVHDSQTGEVQLLMGDDSTPRRVLPGSAITGRGTMFRVTSTNSGRMSWTCNADHILVLHINHKPFIRCNHGKYNVHSIEQEAGADDNPFGQRSKVLRELYLGSYDTQEAAQKHIHRLHSQPFVIECTVRDFLSMSIPLQRLTTMYQPDVVQFQSPNMQRLAVHLDFVDSLNVNGASLELETAWVLGLWLTDGSVGRAIIHQIGNDMKQPGCSHMPVLGRLRRWLRTVYPRENEVANSSRFVPQPHLTSTGNVIYRVHCGIVLHRLLEVYGVLQNKHLSLALLTQSVSVRRAMLEGIIDGDGHYQSQNHTYQLPAKERRFIDGVVHLARGLGFSTNKVCPTKITDEEGNTFDGWHVHMSGADLPILRPTLEYKRCTAIVSNTNQRNDGFCIDEIGEGQYYGFSLDGNGRCLMGDFVVTHNTHMLAALSARLTRADQRIWCVAATNMAARNIACALQGHIDPSRLVLGVSSEYYREWHESAYITLLRQDCICTNVQRLPDRQVVVTTLGFALAALSVNARIGLRRSSLVVDEASQLAALQGVMLLEALHGISRLTLIGDEAQLPPHNIQGSRREVSSILQLFSPQACQQIEASGMRTGRCMLQVQYRMAPKIGRMISEVFYNSFVQNREGAQDTQSQSLLWIDVRGAADRDGTSLRNEQEVIAVEKACAHLLKREKPQNIVVLSFYDAQTNALRRRLGPLGIRACNVDSFQGQEAAVIIISLTAGRNLSSFLMDPRRVNVACSRAQKRLWIIGNRKLFRMTPSVWAQVQTYIP